MCFDDCGPGTDILSSLMFRVRPHRRQRQGGVGNKKKIHPQGHLKQTHYG